MTCPPKDEKREERIHMEIVVDAYDSEEQAMGWYSYLDDNIQFPFKARCIAECATSPLEPGNEVEVVELASADDCEHEMFVLICQKSRKLAVPLSQLEGIQVDEQTQQAIEDWHYWDNRGYEFELYCQRKREARRRPCFRRWPLNLFSRIRDKSFRDAPSGCFSPRSHRLTEFFDTFR